MSEKLRVKQGERVEASELTGDYGEPWAVEVDERRAALLWTEYAAFHQARYPSAFDENGYPVQDFLDALTIVLREETGVAEVYLDGGYSDEPAIEVLVSLPIEVVADGIPLGELGEAVWPVVATLTNVFDPGTFGHIYAVGEAARRARLA